MGEEEFPQVAKDFDFSRAELGSRIRHCATFLTQMGDCFLTQMGDCAYRSSQQHSDAYARRQFIS
jgi:hypothetical protein